MATAAELAERIRVSARRVNQQSGRNRYTYTRFDIAEGLEEIAEAVAKLDPPVGVVADINEDGTVDIKLPGQTDIYAVLSPDSNELGPFARDSETSRKAALANYPRSGSQRERILRHVVARSSRVGERGAIREEIQWELGLGGDTVRPRVKELIEGGWLRETEHTRRTTKGNEAVVLAPTQKAYDQTDAAA